MESRWGKQLLYSRTLWVSEGLMKQEKQTRELVLYFGGKGPGCWSDSLGIRGSPTPCL